jgi:hypothetical protein
MRKCWFGLRGDSRCHFNMVVATGQVHRRGPLPRTPWAPSRVGVDDLWLGHSCGARGPVVRLRRARSAWASQCEGLRAGQLPTCAADRSQVTRDSSMPSSAVRPLFQDCYISAVFARNGCVQGGGKLVAALSISSGSLAKLAKISARQSPSYRPFPGQAASADDHTVVGQGRASWFKLSSQTLGRVIRSTNASDRRTTRARRRPPVGRSGRAAFGRVVVDASRPTLCNATRGQ